MDTWSGCAAAEDGILLRTLTAAVGPGLTLAKTSTCVLRCEHSSHHLEYLDSIRYDKAGNSNIVPLGKSL